MNCIDLLLFCNEYEININYAPKSWK